MHHDADQGAWFEPALGPTISSYRRRAWSGGAGQVDESMVINRKSLDQVARRELQLTIISAVFVLILATGLAAFMYPMVFLRPDDGNRWTMRVAFAGFCILTLLFVGYLFDRQRTVRQLTKHLLDELERNVELRLQASTDLLQNMPNLDHFWDRLSMEYRRAMSMQRTLSLVLVKAESSVRSSGDADTAAWGDTAKAMSHKLRPTDSIYRLAADLFGLVLPGTDTLNANRIAMRLTDELQTVRIKHGLSFEITVHNYPEHVQSAHELEGIVKSLLPEKEDWAVNMSASH
jgi:GGDEF domain-containing protein